VGNILFISLSCHLDYAVSRMGGGGGGRRKGEKKEKEGVDAMT